MPNNGRHIALTRVNIVIDGGSVSGRATMAWKQGEPKGFFINPDAAAGEAKSKMEFGSWSGTVEIFDDRLWLAAPDYSKKVAQMEVPFESIGAISIRAPTLTMMGVLRIN